LVEDVEHQGVSCTNGYDVERDLVRGAAIGEVGRPQSRPARTCPDHPRFAAAASERVVVVPQNSQADREAVCLTVAGRVLKFTDSADCIRVGRGRLRVVRPDTVIAAVEVIDQQRMRVAAE
jgi:hypothetical protein